MAVAILAVEPVDDDFGHDDIHANGTDAGNQATNPQ